jgi:hypothetical protein
MKTMLHQSLALATFIRNKAKSHCIGNVGSFAGYYTARGKIGYIIVVIVNNFDGSAANCHQKNFVKYQIN